MFDSKEIARKSLQRAVQIQDEKAQNRRFGITVGASAAMFAVMFASVLTIFSPGANSGDIVTINEHGVPLSSSQPVEATQRTECTVCGADLQECEGECESDCDVCDSCISERALRLDLFLL